VGSCVVGRAVAMPGRGVAVERRWACGQGSGQGGARPRGLAAGLRV